MKRIALKSAEASLYKKTPDGRNYLPAKWTTNVPIGEEWNKPKSKYLALSIPTKAGSKPETLGIDITPEVLWTTYGNPVTPTLGVVRIVNGSLRYSWFYVERGVIENLKKISEPFVPSKNPAFKDLK